MSGQFDNGYIPKEKHMQKKPHEPVKRQMDQLAAGVHERTIGNNHLPDWLNARAAWVMLLLLVIVVFVIFSMSQALR